MVAPGKTFMRRMFELLNGTRQQHHKIRLSQVFRSDLSDQEVVVISSLGETNLTRKQ